MMLQLQQVRISAMAELRNLLDQSYSKVGALESDIIYLYTDFRHFGGYLDQFQTRSDFCQAFVDSLINSGKTVVVTTFTYTTEGEFHVETTPTALGAMNKWVLSQQHRERSEHPIFSFAALGPRAKQLVKGIGKSAFGYDSVYDRLRNQKASFLHVGRPVSLGNTVLHHIEQICGATYRLNKGFRTKVFESGAYFGTDYTAFLRRRDVEGHAFKFTFQAAAERLRQEGLIRHVGSDDELSNISCYCYDETVRLLSQLFHERQDIFLDTPFMQY